MRHGFTLFYHVSRFTFHDSRFTIHVSRFTFHDSRFTSSPSLTIQVSLELVFSDLALCSPRGHFHFRRPKDRVQHQLAEVIVAPVPVVVAASEAEAPSAVRPFARPRDD